MTLEEERKLYIHDSAGINRYADAIVSVLKDEGDAAPAAYMAIDIVFRRFMQWIHSSQELGVDPELVRGATINLASIMLLELSNRVQIHVDGKTLNSAEWAKEILDELKAELLMDLAQVEAKKRATRQ